jgi:hypothetical protein
MFGESGDELERIDAQQRLPTTITRMTPRRLNL